MQNQAWVNQQVEQISREFLELNINIPASQLLLSAARTAPVKGKLNLNLQQVFSSYKPRSTTPQSIADKLSLIKREYNRCPNRHLLEQVYHLRKIGYLFQTSNFPCLLDGF